MTRPRKTRSPAPAASPSAPVGDLFDDRDHPYGPDPYRYRPDPAAFDIGGDRPPLPIPPVAEVGLVEATGEVEIAFEPVPRRRKRRDGWTPEAQRGFIRALALCGCVTRAAQAVGMSAKSAYRLLAAPGADGFAAAWDQALANGIEALQMAAMERALAGAWVPVMRRGRIVRHEFRHNDRMAIALLSGRVRTVTETRERATSRRKHLAYVAARQAEEDERARRLAEVRAAHRDLAERVDRGDLAPPRPKPRVRAL